MSSFNDDQIRNQFKMTMKTRSAVEEMFRYKSKAGLK